MEQLSFFGTDSGIEDRIDAIFDRVAETSGFNRELFEKTQNTRKDKKKQLDVPIGYSINIGGKLVAKIDMELTKVSADEKAVALFCTDSGKTKKLSSDPDNFTRYTCEENEKGDELLERILVFFTETFIPSERFGCCSRYVECSDALKCLHNDKFHARGCYYRENLENGKIFYGKNTNI